MNPVASFKDWPVIEVEYDGQVIKDVIYKRNGSRISLMQQMDIIEIERHIKPMEAPRVSITIDAILVEKL